MKPFRIRKVGHLCAVENWRGGRVMFAESFERAVECMQIEMLENMFV